jgi:FkbM family methyltransferase
MAADRFVTGLRRIRRAAPGSGGSPGPVPERGAYPTVLVRIGTSDPDVFMQVFGALDYGPIPDTVTPGLIVDCGANVGYASVSLLERFPAAEVIAIEPDPGNAALARQNLAPYADRATVIEAAVWSRSAPLRIRRGAFGDGREWSFQVEECPPGEVSDVEGVGLGDLFASRSVELLKIDIERSEIELFRGPCPWLRLVRNIVIELHDDECSEVFHEALSAYSYEEFSAGQLTFCCNLRARSAA